MKKLKCTLITALTLSFLLTSCGKEKETYDLSPDSMIEHAFESTEDSFFTDWGIDKEAAKKDDLSNFMKYSLSETYDINSHKGQIEVYFEEKRFSGINYQFLFSGTNSFLEDAYDFLYKYDKEINENNWKPENSNVSTFYTKYPTFNDFFKRTQEDDIQAGQLYVVEYENENKRMTVSLTADQENAMVTIMIYEYKYRSLLNRE